MRRWLSVVFAATMLLALLPLTGGAAAAPPGEDPDVIAGSYIVVLERGEPGAVAAEHSRAHDARVNHVYRHALRGYAARMSARAADRISRDPRVDYVEADRVVTTSGTQTNATWGLDRIDQRALDLDGTYTYETTGAGVTAYIIDTGILLDHSEFTGRLVPGFDAVTAGGNANDCNGHGTHVAGTVGGTLYGVAKEVKLSPVRVLGCNGSGTTSGVIAGVDWVTANHAKPAVANMSLGGGASTALDDAVRNSVTAGVTYAVAAGNGNRAGIAQDACGYSPARVSQALTVGATTSSDAKTSWSNYGDCVDLFAPGASITSAWHTGPTDTRTISGTSMASPHVAGVAALYLGTNSEATTDEVFEAVSGNATRNIVTSSRTANNHLLYSLFGAGGGDGGGDGGDDGGGDGGDDDGHTPSIELSDSSYRVNRNFWRASVTVTTDPQTAGVTVSGSFDPGGSGSCTTGSDGKCAIETGNLRNDVVSTLFNRRYLQRRLHLYGVHRARDTAVSDHGFARRVQRVKRTSVPR
jgi:subtilisin family serine protease